MIRRGFLDNESRKDLTDHAGGQRARGGWRIGALELRFSHATPPSASRVRVTGWLVAGQLQVATIAEQPLLPIANRPGRLLIEGFVDTTAGRLRLGEQVAAAIAPSFGALPAPDTLAIVEFVDSPGGLVALHWHPALSPHGAGTGAASSSGAAVAPSGGTGESEGTGSGGTGHGERGGGH